MAKIFILASALASSSAAFAFTKATVNVPFNFESHGKTYPAGKYDVLLDTNHDIILMRSLVNTKASLMWTGTFTDFGPDTPLLSMKFDDNPDGTHELNSIRIAAETTPVLDARERHTAQRAVSISGGR
jgi:hypothetical protein